MTKFILFFLFNLTSLLAHGKFWSNSYVGFNLPPNWSCEVSGTEWTCRSANADQAKQAIIVLTAKQVGPNDNFAYYNQYLKAPKTPKNRDGTAASPSKVEHLKTIQIANHPWADSLHLGSLLPNFYSRYLVTIKDKIAILVTFTAKKEFYTLYSRHFFEAINSLRITTNAQNNKITGIKGPDEELGQLDMNAEGDGDSWSDEQGQQNNIGTNEKKSNMLLYGIVLLLIGGAALILIKKKKK